MAVFGQAPVCRRTVPALFSWVSGGLFDGPGQRALKGVTVSLAHERGLISWVLIQASTPGCRLSPFHALEGDLMWGPKPQGSPKPPLR